MADEAGEQTVAAVGKAASLASELGSVKVLMTVGASCVMAFGALDAVKAICVCVTVIALMVLRAWIDVAKIKARLPVKP